MNRILIRLAIVVAIVFELAWTFQLRNLSSPKSPETVQAIHVYQASPTAENKATMLEQIHRDVSHNARHGQILFGLMVLADIAAIYFFWNYGVTKPAA